MRLLKLFAAAIVTTALLQLAPAPAAQAATFTCDWTTVSTDAPLLGGYTGSITAGPLVEQGATSVSVICEVLVNGSVRISDAQTTPGPAGFYAMSWHLFDLEPGDSAEVCTYTIAHPAGTFRARGCNHAFTY